MQTVYNLLILYVCLNTGVATMMEAFGVDIGIPALNAIIDITGLQETLSDMFSDDGGFQPALIFGDWYVVARLFINFFTGGYLVGIADLLGAAHITFPSAFTAGLSALSAIALLWGLMYIISGRGTRASD